MDALALVLVAGKVVVVVMGVLTVVAGLTLAERKVAAWIQWRHGPNRVGPWGLFQPVADGIKFFFKEDLIPGHVHKFLYVLAPFVMMVPAFAAFAAIPFGPPITLFGREFTLQIADMSVGFLWIFALTSLGVYGLAVAGWASNNKYSLFGGLRSAAQLVSYELPLGLSVIGVVMIAGTFNLQQIVAFQSGQYIGFLPSWNVFVQPLGFLMFVVASLAETNRLPFDLPEAEQELVGGYHTEYSSMKFAAFFMSEYANVITSAALAVTLFLGGWHFPGVDSLGLSPLLTGLVYVGVFAAKCGLYLFFVLWTRWTFPRFRYDQLMHLGWKVLLPLGFANIVFTGIYLAVAGV
jgi:NADH-quinone oxidoreductase subunit H